MKRKSNRTVSILWVGGLLVIGIAAFAVIYLTKSYVADPFRTIQDFPYAQYQDNSIGLRGNTYKIEGVIENQLGVSNAKGRLVSVRANFHDTAYYVAVYFPPSFDGMNIQKGQRFVIMVKVADKGMLEVQEIKKY